jgi:hypothetical protein
VCPLPQFCVALPLERSSMCCVLIGLHLLLIVRLLTRVLSPLLLQGLGPPHPIVVGLCHPSFMCAPAGLASRRRPASRSLIHLFISRCSIDVAYCLVFLRGGSMVLLLLDLLGVWFQVLSPSALF